MNKAVALATDIIATYRLTKLVMEDKIAEDFRDYIYERFPRDSKISYFIGCPWCVSIWAGAVIFALRRLDPQVADIVSGILTASALTGVAYTKGL
jgi:hypothetical protein